MKPVLFVVLATVFYAIANVILEKYFSKTNSLTTVVIYASTVAVLAFTVRQITKNGDASFVFPSGWMLLLAVGGMGVMFFFADYCYIKAYNAGGSLALVTVVVSTMPIVAAAIKAGFSGKLPSYWQIAGFVLAVLAVVCVVKGQQGTES